MAKKSEANETKFFDGFIRMFPESWRCHIFRIMFGFIAFCFLFARCYQMARTEDWSAFDVMWLAVFVFWCLAAVTAHEQLLKTVSMVGAVTLIPSSGYVVYSLIYTPLECIASTDPNDPKYGTFTNFIIHYVTQLFFSLLYLASTALAMELAREVRAEIIKQMVMKPRRSTGQSPRILGVEEEERRRKQAKKNKKR